MDVVMKNSLSCFLLLATLPTLYAATGSEADDGKPVSSRITDVTVYADRAQVTRKADVELAAGSQRLAFIKLPGWVDEGSVRVALVPPNAGEILDVQVRRTFLSKASDEEVSKAEAAVRDIADQIAALDDEKAVLEAESKQIDAIRAFSLDKLPKDVAVREIKPGEYGESIKFVTGSLREIATAKRELEKKRRDLQPELLARQRRLDALRQRSQLEERAVVVTLNGSAKTAELRLTYMLPGATWEPVHELRATPDGKAVALSSHAVVRQTSGEDWTGVNLWLSTQRSTETLKIPELESLLLGAGRKIARVSAASQSSFSAANDYFLGNNGTWFDLQNSDVAQQKDYRANFAALDTNAKRVEQLFETMRERGTTAHFPALGAQIIRSDGAPVRVPIGSAEIPAQHRLLAAPELSLNAAHIVDLTNSTKQALLPGKVSLYLDGAFLGLTETDFVAPGESFSLYLGVAEEIKLSRTLDKKHSELKRSGQRTRIVASFLVSAENLSDHSVSVQLAERIPVSETDEIKVSGVKISPDGKPDAKGLLRWDLDLGPKKRREFRVEYTIEYPNDIIQRAAAAEAKPGAQQDMMMMRIKDLEGKF
jgi:uncharacterized protein (TIGR02231 family)